MTPQTIITEARYILNDTVSTRYRNTDAELLAWVNDGLDAMVGVRPDLFVTSSSHTCTAGAEQAPSFARLVRVLNVPRVVSGGAILPADKAALDAFLPAWYSATPGAAVNWLQHTDPKKFYLSPPAAITQDVQVEFVQAPVALAIGDTVPISDNYQTALVSFVVAFAEAKDDESVDSNRAAQFKSEFAALISGVGK